MPWYSKAIRKEMKWKLQAQQILMHEVYMDVGYLVIMYWLKNVQEVSSVCLIHNLNDSRDNIKFNYFTEVSLFFNIIPQHHDALVSSWHSFYNGHSRN
jgi:hypothetical protein